MCVILAPLPVSWQPCFVSKVSNLGHTWWVPAAVTLDITLRFIGFPSPTKQVSIIIVRQLREWVGGGRPSWGNTVEAGAPKQVGGGVVLVEMRVNTPNTPSLAPPRATAAREPSLAHHARCIVVVY